MKATVAVAVIVAAVAVAQVEADRYETNLLTEFTFSQAECKARAFADNVGDDHLGGLTYPSEWDTLEKCPTYTDGDGTVFEYAYNGMHSQGGKFLSSAGSVYNLTVDDSAKSTEDITDLKVELDSVTDFSLEFWIVPEASISSGSRKYVLLEIGAEPGSGQYAGDDYAWSCSDTGTQHYNLQVLYNSGSSRFELEYRFGSADNNCDSVTLDATLVAGNLYYVVITSVLAAGAGFGGSDLQGFYLYVNNVEEDVASGSADNIISFTDFDSTHVLRLGSSPATLSTSADPSVSGYHSFPGDILHFSFYKEALGTTEIEDNFDAKLLNSAPVAANAPVRHDFSEDQYVTVDLEKAVFDFDNIYALTTDTMTYTLTGVTPGSLLGHMFSMASSTFAFLNAVTVNPVSAPLLWMNAVEDEWGWSNSTWFTVTGSDGSATSATATISPRVAGTNDGPMQTEGTEVADSTPQADAQLLEFHVTDADCATRPVQWSSGAPDADDTTLLDDSCTTYGQIASITIVEPNSTNPLGVLYLPNATGDCPPFDGTGDITTDTPFDSGDDEWVTGLPDGQAAVRLCFEACLTFPGSQNPCPAGVDGGATAILGDAVFEFFANDGTDTGPTGSVTTTVTNVLTVTEKSYVTDEEVVKEVVLEGSDAFCERFDSVLCPRYKSFLIDTLPPAHEGVFYLDEELTIPVVEGETYVDNNVTLTLYLKPAEDYFSANQWPICGPAIRTEANPGVSAWSFSYCINSDDGIETFPCEGPLCAGYYNTMPAAFGDALTTADLEGNAMGGCGASVDVGCPVELVVSLVVGNLTSEPLAGASVHVVNANDEPSVAIPAANLSDVVRAVETPVAWSDANGETQYLTIDDSDGDARVMDVVVTTPSSGQLSFKDVNRPLGRRLGGWLGSLACRLDLEGLSGHA